MHYCSDNNLQEHAIVTGGTRGIGKAISLKLMELGYFVHIIYKSNSIKANELYEQYQNKCQIYKIDGSDSMAVEKFVFDCSEKYNLTTLVNNIGVTKDALIHDLSWHNFKLIFDVNVGSIFNFTKAVLPSMKKRYGNIINISSVSSTMIRPGNSLYGASKVAIERFSQSISFEYARYNIATNVIVPRLVLTDMNRDYIEENRTQIINRTPSRNLTSRDEVSEMVATLLTRKPVLHGAIVHVTGGAHISTD